MVDDELVRSINWIKEGTFSKKEGAPTLKLIGEVQPIDTVEVVKKERVNRLKEYPLSATELADKIKAKSFGEGFRTDGGNHEFLNVHTGVGVNRCSPSMCPTM